MGYSANIDVSLAIQCPGKPLVEAKGIAKKEL